MKPIRGKKFVVTFRMNDREYEVKAKSPSEAEKKAWKVFKDDVDNNIGDIVTDTSIQ
jgi:hypothetical protein